MYNIIILVASHNIILNFPCKGQATIVLLIILNIVTSYSLYNM